MRKINTSCRPSISKSAGVDFSEHPSKRLSIHQAAQNGHIELVHRLIKDNADVDARGGDDWPPLMLAAQETRFPVGYMARSVT